jgi:hypothetical protein
MLKAYNELRQLDVRPHCEERDGLLYLNWAKCIDLLHENGAEKVYWEPIPDPATGSSLRMVNKIFEDKNKVANQCYETRIKVVIDDNVYEMQSPVMNGSNPVKDNSMSQQRVWNSMCRSFVKCVAINTGLGFDLWLKEESRPFSTGLFQGDEKASNTEIHTVKVLCEKYNIQFERWVASNNKKVDQLTKDDVGNMLITINEKYGE